MKRSLFLLCSIAVATSIAAGIRHTVSAGNSAHEARQHSREGILRLVDPELGRIKLVSQSTASSFNIDSTHFIVDVDGVINLYRFDSTSMRVDRQGSLFDHDPIKSDECLWSSEDRSTLIALVSSPSPQVHTYDVRTGQYALLKDFSAVLPAGEVNDFSKSWADDNRFAFAWREPQSAAWHYLAVWDREIDRTYLLDLSDPDNGVTGFRDAHLAKWGDYVVINAATTRRWQYSGDDPDDAQLMGRRVVDSRAFDGPVLFNWGLESDPPVGSTSAYAYLGAVPITTPTWDWETVPGTSLYARKLPPEVTSVAYVESQGRELSRQNSSELGPGRWFYDRGATTLYLRLLDDSNPANQQTVIGVLPTEAHHPIRIPRQAGGPAEIWDREHDVWAPLPGFRGNVSRDGRFTIFSSGQQVYIAELASEVGTPEDITWTNLVNCTPTSDSLEKTSGVSQLDDASANSEQVLTGDGFIEFTALETNRDRACGLNDVNQPNAAVKQIDYAIRLNPAGRALVMEDGKKRLKVKYKRDHVFRIAVEQGFVKYYRNDLLIYTSDIAPLAPLQASASLLDTNSRVSRGRIRGGAPNVRVTVNPLSASLLPGEQLQFIATVEGSTDQAVTWSTTGSASEGTISAGGLFTAPTSAGEHVVTATSAVNPRRSGSATVLVAGSVDDSPPVISGVAASSISAGSAGISWITNEVSDSEVEYGLSTSYGQSSLINPALVTNHGMSLSGLAGNTVYHYRVKSRDAAGNLAVSGDFTFQTASSADTTPPSLSGITATGITSTSATVLWTTDDLSDSQVEYGTTAAYGSSTSLNTLLVTNHSAVLNGLSPATTYHFRVRSRDAAGNLATSTDFTFATTSSSDTTPPVITAVGASGITSASAIVGWTTNEPSDTQVDYGTTTAYGSASSLDASLVLGHTVTLSGLSPNTTYHYRVKSRDSAGNLAILAGFSFVTTAAADTAPPVISGVSATAITSSAASLNWTTNEVSDTQVDWGLTSAYGNTTTLSTALITSHTVTLNSLAASTTYHYRVKSRDAAGNLATSGDFTFTTSAAPDTTPPVITGVGTSGVASSAGTINWTTNEVSDTQVDWGLTSAYGNTTPLSSALVTSHSVTLSGLAASTTYNYRVKSRDAAGNLATSGNFTFTTSAAPDTTPPVISGVGTSGVTFNSGTVNWTTNEASNTQVDWGLTSAYGNTTPLNSALVTSHSVALSGLAASTTYNYRVKSRDAAGNLATSGNFIFTTSAAPDTTPPVISGVGTSGVTPSSATINWTTNEASNTQVDWGLTSSYGNTTPLSTAMVTAHSAALSGLAANTTYHYRVKSRDAAGNLATSGDFTFTTATPLDTTPPVISNVAASGITSSGATITWTTNEASDTQVDYGLTSSYGSSTPLNSAQVASHSATLSGLASATLYHYRVRSRDAAGNLAISGDFTFTTSSSSPSAGTFYVATTGSDSNPGTETQPFRTIARGIQALASGNTLIIKAGTYAEGISNAVPSGTSWSSPTTVRANPGETVIIRPSGGQRALDVTRSTQQFIAFEGLILDGVNTGTNSTVKITSGAHHIRIRNCEIMNSPLANGILITDIRSSNNEIINCNIHHNGLSWIGPDAPPHGIYISTDNNLVDGCHIHDNRNGYGIHTFGDSQSNNVIRNNLINNNQDGVLIDGDSNLFYNNVLYGHGIDLQIASGSSSITGNKILNNTFYNSGLAIAVGHENPGTNASGTIVRNNICWAVGGQAVQIVIHPDAAGTTMENNLTRNSIRNNGVSSTLAGNITGDPLFISTAGLDLHVQLSSPARNAGRTVAEVTSDKDGVSRPQGGAYDIGAYER